MIGFSNFSNILYMYVFCIVEPIEFAAYHKHLFTMDAHNVHYLKSTLW
jgi:hypothetical protein